jgi:hypothetical protein
VCLATASRMTYPGFGKEFIPALAAP